MLCALSVGLASGVGLYGLAAIGTAFLVVSLWILEGFEPQTRVFELSLKLGDATQDLKPKIEQILRRYKVRYELRISSAEEVGVSGDHAAQAADRQGLERNHGAGPRGQGRGRVGREVEGQGAKVT